jgi:hypothetical protein
MKLQIKDINPEQLRAADLYKDGEYVGFVCDLLLKAFELGEEKGSRELIVREKNPKEKGYKKFDFVFRGTGIYLKKISDKTYKGYSITNCLEATLNNSFIDLFGKNNKTLWLKIV